MAPPAPWDRGPRPLRRRVIGVALALAVLAGAAGAWLLLCARTDAPDAAAPAPAPRASAGAARARDDGDGRTPPPLEPALGPARPALAPPGSAAPAPRRVRGRVVDEQGAPVGGVLLRLRERRSIPGASGRAPHEGHGGGGSFRGRAQPVELPVGPDGRFEAEVPAGTALLLEAHAEGWLSAATLLVADATGEVVLPLVRPRKVEGVVLDLVSGRPLRGARVTGSPQGAAPFPAPPLVTHTGEQGEFTLEGLPPGPVLVEGHLPFLSEAGPALEAARRLPPPGLSPSGAVRAEAGDGARVTLRVWAGYRIEGEVRGPSGRPARAPLRLSLYARDPAGRPNPRARLLAHLGPGEPFAFVELPGGRFDLHVEPRGPDEDGAELAPAWLRDVAAGATGLALSLEAGVRLRIRRVEPGGRPLRTAEGWVLVEPEDGPEGAPDGVGAVFDGDAWVTEPLPAGRRHRVLAGGVPGRARGRTTGVVPRPGPPAQDPVLVELAPAGRIVGRVLTVEGAPAPARIPVRAFAEVPGADPRLAEAVATTLTDPEGRFELAGLGPGPFRLLAGGAGAAWAPAGTEAGLQVGGGEATLRVRPGATLSGRLVSPAGAPLPDALLLAYGPEGLPTVMARTADLDGLFLLAGLPPGPVSLALRRGDQLVVLGSYAAPATRLRVVAPGG